MKITKRRLRKIIKEEKQALLKEYDVGMESRAAAAAAASDERDEADETDAVPIVTTGTAGNETGHSPW